MSLIAETDEQYNARPGVRATILKEMLRSPAHAHEMMLRPRESTPAMELGTAVHAAILQPDVFEKYIVSPKFDRRTKEGKAAAAEFELANAGRTPIDAEKYQILEGCVKSVYAHDYASMALSSGRSELTAAWEDSGTGLLCKARPDFINEDGIIIDVKTCSDASPAAFVRQVVNLNYHLQAYHYLRGISAALNEQHEKFMIIAVETKAPYTCAVYQFDDAAMNRAKNLWSHAMESYAQCSALNEWPGYFVGIQPLGLPAWAAGGAWE